MINCANTEKGEIRLGSQKSAFSNTLKPQSHQMPSNCLVALLAVVLLCDREEKEQYFSMVDYVPQKSCTKVYHSSVLLSRLKSGKSAG